MKQPSSRLSLAPAVALALMLTQLVVGHAGVFAGALAAGFLGHGHGHELSLVGDSGHVDVVLHHGDREDQGGTLGAGLGAHEGDHVVHFAVSDTAREGKPRITPLALALPASAPTAPREIGSLPLGGVAVAAGASSALLRTVVLRI